ncbi:MAG: trehalase family glycosidase [candidate division KSB1 bacterium]|jgi:hypothetical protein|nr:trehalase family glycosidase [candidate division KSB1 bacterium]
MNKIESIYGQGGSANQPLPEDWRHRVPQPVLDDHPEWIDMYYRCWEIAASSVRLPNDENGFVSPYMDENFSPQIFMWDTAFMVMFGRYAPDLVPGIRSLDNFYVKQHEDGYICREIQEWDGQDFWPKANPNTLNPPLMEWVEWECFLLGGDIERLESVLPNLTRHFRWIQSHRINRRGLYWSNGLSSGMDNVPRPSIYPADADPTMHMDWKSWPLPVEPLPSWICLTAQQAQSAYYIKKIAEIVGDEKTRDEYSAEYELLSKKINAEMWDDARGLYVDLERDGSMSSVKSIAAFWPLLGKIAPNERVVRMIREHLLNENEFNRPHRVPTLSYDHPLYSPDGDYWRGSVWPPTNYMLVKGLEQYGFHHEAMEIVGNHLMNMADVFAETGTIWENYAPESAKPGSISRPDFVGWSGCGPIAMLIENIIGLKLNAAQNEIHWDIYRQNRFGVRNLSFKRKRVSLVVNVTDNDAEFTIDSQVPFRLKIKLFGRKEFEREIAGGKETFHVAISW